MVLSDTDQAYHEPSHNCDWATTVSELSQASEPGRDTLRNAQAAEFGNFEVVDTTYAYFFSIDKASYNDFQGVQIRGRKARFIRNSRLFQMNSRWFQMIPDI